MKSIISLVALLFACLTVSSVSGQVINDRLSLFFEYLSPVWRRHRARFVPYVFANPVHLFRLARSVDTEGSLSSIHKFFKSERLISNTQLSSILVDKQLVHCMMSNSTISCQRYHSKNSIFHFFGIINLIKFFY